MASIHVDVELGEFRTYELVDELSNRGLCLNHKEKQELLDAIKYDDSEKWKWFLSIKDQYSLLELQEKFNEGATPINSKDQLQIPFELTQTKQQ